MGSRAISGRAIDLLTHHPVQDAALRVVVSGARGDSPFRASFDVVTDDAGRFSGAIDVPEAVRLDNIRAEHDGIRSVYARVPEEGAEVGLVLDLGKAIVGAVGKNSARIWVCRHNPQAIDRSNRLELYRRREREWRSIPVALDPNADASAVVELDGLSQNLFYRFRFRGKDDRGVDRVIAEGSFSTPWEAREALVSAF